MSITIERVSDIAGCEACHGVASKVWGEEAACSIPQMLVHATYGGVVLLARDNGVPVGFVFSFPAIYHDTLVLWSHETAVLPEYLHQGLGTKLKMEQWLIAKEMPYTAVAWTFDPLISRNAHFNLNKLGACISEYKVNAYGIMDDFINGKLETDRFIAVWPIDNKKVFHGEPLNRKVLLKLDSRTSEQNPLPDIDRLCDLGERNTVVETRIPLEMERVFRESPSASKKWRSTFREAALLLYAEGYNVVQFERNETYGVYVWQS